MQVQENLKASTQSMESLLNVTKDIETEWKAREAHNTNLSDKVRVDGNKQGSHRMDVLE